MTVAVLLSVVLGCAQASPSGSYGLPKRAPGLVQLQTGTYLAQVKAFSSLLTMSGPEFRSFTPQKLVEFIGHRMKQPEASLAELAAGDTILTALKDEAAGVRIVLKLSGVVGGKPAAESLKTLMGRFSDAAARSKLAETVAKLDLSIAASADALFDGLVFEDSFVVVPEAPIKGTLLLAKSGAAKVGSSVVIRMGPRKLIGVFLGGSRDKSGRPVSYFFDTATHEVVWARPDQIQWDEAFEPASFTVEKQDGPDCMANALANCVNYLADVSHALKPTLSREAKERLLADAIVAMGLLRAKSDGMAGSRRQDRYALKSLKKAGLGGRLSWRWSEVRAHLDKGLPALLGLRVKPAPTRDTSLWAEGKAFPGETPNRYLTRFVPSPETPATTVRRYGEFMIVETHKTVHEVVALGRFKADGGAFIIVADSGTGEIFAWPEDDVMGALEGGQIMVGTQPQSLLTVYLRQHGILR